MGQWLTVEEAAASLGVSIGLIYQACRRRAITHIRPGSGRGTIRISPQALEQYSKSRLIVACRPTPEPPAPSQRARGTRRATGAHPWRQTMTNDMPPFEEWGCEA